MPRWMHGLGVSGGEAAGPVARIGAVPALGGPVPVADPDAEVARASEALAAVGSWLAARAGVLSGPARDVLEAQVLIAQDPALADGVSARIRQQGFDAPHAIAETFAEHRRALEAIGGYLGERAADLDDLRDRAIARLLGQPMPGVPAPGYPFVLVAGDLSPADTAVLDAEQVLAIVTERGGPTSHTAILAKQLGIPAVVACADAAGLSDGQYVLVDGIHGEVVADPEDELVAAAVRRREQRAARRAASRGPGATADGVAVPLLANIGGPGDLSGLGDAEGVGLFRTEFLFLDRASAPTVAEQQQAYAQVFESFAGRRVVVRTLDVGADKPLAYLPSGAEANPALGVRGLRLGRRVPELLDEQLGAIAAAAARCEAEVWVMAPMVATVEEAREFAAAARGRGFAKVGVMIEVPAAALCARAILAEVDFASLGTNDLTQYTLAADRLEGALADLLDPWQPAVLALIGMTGAAGTALERSIGVCGEAASDPLLAQVLVGLGVRSLSMAPSCIADVRAALAEVPLEVCAAMAQEALAAGSAVGARAAAEQLRSSAVGAEA